MIRRGIAEPDLLVVAETSAAAPEVQEQQREAATEREVLPNVHVILLLFTLIHPTAE